MSIPGNSFNNQDQWQRYCDLQWFDSELGFWLDVSRMNLNSAHIDQLRPKFENAFALMKDLEKGAIANIDENRQVGHYWLRNPSIAPDTLISKSISAQVNEIETFADQIRNGFILSSNSQPFTDVLWIGIGGSSLGPVLIINALADNNQGLKFHFIDNVDPDGISNTLTNLHDRLHTTLFVVVSKSGGTPEPNIAMNQSRKTLELAGGNWPRQAVAITMSNSKLDKIANSQSWLATFDLPSWVGGRTSITSAVGLLPAALSNIHIRDFLSGASAMDEATRATELTDNPAALLSASWYIAGSGKGLKDMVVLPYKDRLEVFSRYLQQLVMESLGKRNDKNGNTVHQGIAVYGNKGSTDQHAYVQQLRDGIDNFFVTFIEVITDTNELTGIDNQSPGDYLSGFLQGTRLALSEGGRENLTITITELNAISLGALVALFERSVGFYADIVNINAYDQPGVEAGKSAASNILNLQQSIEHLLKDKKSRTVTQISDELNSNSCESIFIILRHLTTNSPNYQYSGNYDQPNEMRFYMI